MHQSALPLFCWENGDFKKKKKPFAYYAQQNTFYEVIHTVQRIRASDGNALQMSSPAKHHLV